MRVDDQIPGNLPSLARLFNSGKMPSDYDAICDIRSSAKYHVVGWLARRSLSLHVMTTTDLPAAMAKFIFREG